MAHLLEVILIDCVLFDNIGEENFDLHRPHFVVSWRDVRIHCFRISKLLQVALIIEGYAVVDQFDLTLVDSINDVLEVISHAFDSVEEDCFDLLSGLTANACSLDGPKVLFIGIEDVIYLVEALFFLPNRTFIVFLADFDFDLVTSFEDFLILDFA